MPSFRYEATDALGKIVRGTVEADTERGARNQLRGRGAACCPPPRRARRGGRLRARLSDADLAWLTRQLASLLAARLCWTRPSAPRWTRPRKSTSPRCCWACATTRAGKLSAALAARPRDFPEIYRALIGAGEESGDLAQVMEKLADYIEERNCAAR